MNSILGLYSRGKSHVLRLSVATEILLSMWDQISADVHEQNDITTHEDPTTDDPPPSPPSDTSSTHDDNDVSDQDIDITEQDAPTPNLTVSPQAIGIAYSIVNTCLSQLCKHSLNSFPTLIKNLIKSD